jgi:DNA-binding NarL/FixJ family response regulator
MAMDGPGPPPAARGPATAAGPARPLRLDILVVVDVRLYRELLGSALAGQPRVGEVRAAADLPGACAELAARTPDLVLVDLRSTGCDELLRAVHASAPAARVIVLGVDEDEVPAYAEVGVHGHLLRSEPVDQLVRLIGTVVSGETLCTPRVSALLMRRVAALAAERRPRPRVPVLTPREDQVLHLLEQGLSNQDIAESLGIEVRTVKNHVHHLLEKVGARRRGEAVAVFRRLQSGSMAGS